MTWLVHYVAGTLHGYFTQALFAVGPSRLVSDNPESRKEKDRNLKIGAVLTRPAWSREGALWCLHLAAPHPRLKMVPFLNGAVLNGAVLLKMVKMVQPLTPDLSHGYSTRIR